MARNETCAAWSSLLSRIAPPLAAVCDGGGGVLKALRTVWPSTRVQRCLFHVCMNITELTGLRPRLEAGKSLRKAAVALSRVSDADSAAEWLARTTPEKLAAALVENADEPQAEKLAEALAGRRFARTLELADAVRDAAGEADAEMALRRVFQALRIEVNEEFTALDMFLRVLPSVLKPGGRAAILTFHSGEDRRVKKAYQAFVRNGTCAAMSDRVVTAGPEERRANPRSSPAKLRWLER